MQADKTANNIKNNNSKMMIKIMFKTWFKFDAKSHLVFCHLSSRVSVCLKCANTWIKQNTKTITRFYAESKAGLVSICKYKRTYDWQTFTCVGFLRVAYWELAFVLCTTRRWPAESWVVRWMCSVMVKMLKSKIYYYFQHGFSEQHIVEKFQSKI